MEITSSPEENQTMARVPVGRLFWRYSLPAVAGMLVNGLYSVIDAIFIGQVVGAEGLAAMNLVWPVFGVIIGIGLMIGMGTSALSSIARGEGRLNKARQTIGNSFTLMFLVSLIIVATMLFANKPIIELMGASGNVLAMAESYLFIITITSIVSIGGAALPMMVRNDERPQLATVIMSTGALLNIALDYLFIVVWQQEVEGAAIATILAQAVTMIWGFGYFFSTKARIRMNRKDLRVDWDIYRNILVTGLPSLIMFAYMSFVLAVHNRLFLQYGTVTTLAAFTIVGYIQACYYMTAEGIANGMQPLVSFNHGAGNNRNIHTLVWMATKVILGLGIVTVILINLFPGAIASVFNNENPQLLQETTMGLRLHLMTMFLDGFIVVVAAYFQSLAKTKAATMITLGNMFVQIPLLLTLPKLFGVYGVWLSLPISNVFLAAVAFWLLLKDLKQRPVGENDQ